jgi:hypothetical protein
MTHGDESTGPQSARSPSRYASEVHRNRNPFAQGSTPQLASFL